MRVLTAVLPPPQGEHRRLNVNHFDIRFRNKRAFTKAENQIFKMWYINHKTTSS